MQNVSSLPQWGKLKNAILKKATPKKDLEEINKWMNERTSSVNPRSNPEIKYQL